jgi:hypothetical protein
MLITEFARVAVSVIPKNLPLPSTAQYGKE